MADLADADYVVVGGGITGCVIASRLSQSGDSDQKKPQVVLLEAGPDPAGNPAAAGFLSGLSLLGSEYDYSFRTERVSGTADRVHTLNVGKVLGGGSILNLGGWLRADAADYDDWGHAVGDERWSYAGLKPWFCKTERFFSGDDVDTDTEHYGRDGPMHVAPVSVGESGIRKYPLREPVREAWAELGVPANLRRKHGRNGGLVEFSENAREGMRQPAQSVYPLDGGENPVRVYTNTLVRRVIFSEKDKNGVTTAIGVELADGRTITARKEVILCAGAFRTPQVLMLSGIGPSAVLEAQGIPLVHDAPDVGQNLHDHFALYLAYRLRDPSLGQALGSAAFQAKMDPKFSNSPLPWDCVVSQPLPAEVIEKHASEAGKTTTEKQHMHRNLFEVITIYVPPIPGIPIDGSHIATSAMLLRPTSRGTVTLRSRDPNDAPRIQPNHLATTLDRDTLVHAARTTLKAMLETTSMKAIVAGESPPSVIGLGSEGEGLESPLVPLTADDSEEVLEDRIRRKGMAHAHPGGTAAMGKVVDTEGKVLGVKGLRVADASIIPIPFGGHPQATLYAMAEQLASFILRDD